MRDNRVANNQIGDLQESARRGESARLWWGVHYALVVVVTVTVGLIGTPVAGFIAGGGVILSAVWTAVRYPSSSDVPSEARHG